MNSFFKPSKTIWMIFAIFIVNLFLYTADHGYFCENPSVGPAVQCNVLPYFLRGFPTEIIVTLTIIPIETMITETMAFSDESTGITFIFLHNSFYFEDERIILIPIAIFNWGILLAYYYAISCAISHLIKRKRGTVTKKIS